MCFKVLNIFTWYLCKKKNVLHCLRSGEKDIVYICKPYFFQLKVEFGWTLVSCWGERFKKLRCCEILGLKLFSICVCAYELSNNSLLVFIVCMCVCFVCFFANVVLRLILKSVEVQGRVQHTPTPSRFKMRVAQPLHHICVYILLKEKSRFFRLPPVSFCALRHG